MKTRIIFFIFSTILFHSANAQKIKTGYGKVTKNELEMESYSMDENTSAVILSEKVFIYYKDISDNLKVQSDHYVKIKILANEGTEYTNIEIPYYAGKSITSYSEKVQNLKATSYNLNNGKIEKTELEKKYIFEEQINTYWKQIKFTLPNVKAGTVIEYQYQKISDFWHQIPDLEMQHDIPVYEGYYEAMIPYFLDFNISYKKNFPMEIEEKIAPRSFTTYIRNSGGAGAAAYATSAAESRGTMTHDCRKVTFKTVHMPATKKESYNWCKKDFIASASFELKGTGVASQGNYKPYSTTWENVDEELLKENNFGKWLQITNPYQSDLRTFNLKEITDKKERIKLAVELLKNKMAWNDKYEIYSNDLPKAIKNGEGSNAELNFVLLSILRDMGIRSYPVVLSTRSRGRLPMVFPTTTKLNTFLVAAETNENQFIYLDGSVPTNNIGILPTELMVENARIIRTDHKSTWVDLNQQGKNTLHIHVDASVNENGILSGKVSSKIQGRFIAEYENNYGNIPEEKIKEKKEEKLEMKITDLEIKGLNTPLEDIIEIYNFEKKLSSTNERLYFNPMLFQHISSNPFIEEERNIPVDLAYPYTFRITTSIKLPDNYEVEEFPKTAKVSLGKENSYIYAIEHKEGKISVNYTFTLKQTLFMKENYKDLVTFFASIAEKNNETVVLKKKQN